MEFTKKYDTPGPMAPWAAARDRAAWARAAAPGPGPWARAHGPMGPRAHGPKWGLDNIS